MGHFRSCFSSNRKLPANPSIKFEALTILDNNENNNIIIEYLLMLARTFQIRIGFPTTEPIWKRKDENQKELTSDCRSREKKGRKNRNRKQKYNGATEKKVQNDGYNPGPKGG
jgi:hypothetical protein